MNDPDVFVIEASGVGKVYWDGDKTLQVLKNVSLTVKKGELLAILGPSGSGKTTLLNILSGLDRPSEGSVRLEGQDIHGLSDGRSAKLRNERIGFVFQFYHLLPEFTALENVMLPVLMRRAKGKGQNVNSRARALSLLHKVGLKDRQTHYPSELSGGEQQRAALARALMNDPAILFCDEPTGNLDRATGKEVAGLIKDLSVQENKTVLVVTHDEGIAAMATRVWNMTRGENES
jgi:lipoprotein-releasing system ATP-binding protein